jgi:hypothetical protein
MNKITCPACGTVFDVSPASAGLSVPCPNCGQLVAAPAAPTGSGGPGGTGGAAPQTCGLATAAMIVGIVGLLCVPPLVAIVALILGIVALGKIDRSVAEGRPLLGRGRAVAGIALGAVGTVIIVPLMIGILVPALGAAKKQANRIKNGTQVRGTVEALALWSDANTSSSDFPGAMKPEGLLPFNASYNAAQPTTARFWNLFAPAAGDSLNGKLLVNPVQNADKAYIDTPISAGCALSEGRPPLAANNISYALLDPGSVEWRNNTNANAILVGDKDVANDPRAPRSYWSGSRPWEGHLGWGDVHVSWGDMRCTYQSDSRVGDLSFTIGQNTVSAADQGNTIFAPHPQAANSTGLYLINPN